ncbi:MAG: hypothetical protein N3E40_02030 [Dehalococcoidia bacterium]|nr:hypothetical protein [Dehalococcoidia bacterium]
MKKAWKRQTDDKMKAWRQAQAVRRLLEGESVENLLQDLPLDVANAAVAGQHLIGLTPNQVFMAVLTYLANSEQTDDFITEFANQLGRFCAVFSSQTPNELPLVGFAFTAALATMAFGWDNTGLKGVVASHPNGHLVGAVCEAFEEIRKFVEEEGE